jgi:hypothetical protein
MKERNPASARLGVAAFEQLASGLTGSELHSVLLPVMQQRARRRAPKEVLAQYQGDGFCAPSALDLRTSVALDAHLLAAADGFEALELSPITPLGTCTTVALTGQDRIVSALRMTEVVSDPTNVLALECALRLRGNPANEVHLTAVQRVVRAQPIRKRPGFSRHFRLFVLASAAQERKAHAFTVDTLVRHVQIMTRALDGLEQQGYAFGKRRIEILATADKQALGDRIAEGLGGQAVQRPLDHPYYSGGLRYMLWATATDGAELLLVDGGSFDWVAKLGSDRRAVYVASGAGAQVMALRFRNVG